MDDMKRTPAAPFHTRRATATGTRHTTFHDVAEARTDSGKLATQGGPMWRTMVTVVLLGCGDKGDSTDDQDPGDDPVDCEASEVPYDGIDQDCGGAAISSTWTATGTTRSRPAATTATTRTRRRIPARRGHPLRRHRPGLRRRRPRPTSTATATTPSTPAATTATTPTRRCTPAPPRVSDDGIDQDCDGVDVTDLDGDGWESAAPGGQGHDCDDADPTIFPDAVDTPFDGIDTDCRADCDYDADHDGAVPAEWVGSITDGDPCDRDGSMNIRVDEDCDDTNPDASTQHIDAVTPLDGAVGVAAQVEMSVRLADEEYDASARLLDGNGDPVYIRDDNTGFDIYISRINEVSNYSGYPLDAYTTYTIEVTHSCGVETTTFTTGDGLAPVDPYAMVGVVWGATPTGIQNVRVLGAELRRVQRDDRPGGRDRHRRDDVGPGDGGDRQHRRAGPVCADRGGPERPVRRKPCADRRRSDSTSRCGSWTSRRTGSRSSTRTGSSRPRSSVRTCSSCGCPVW